MRKYSLGLSSYTDINIASLAIKLKRITCNREYNFDRNRYLCDHCRKKLDGKLFTFPGILDVKYDYERVRKVLTKKILKYRKSSIWKYEELLPIFYRKNMISMGEGKTFLAKCERLEHKLGMKNLYIKNETSNPSGCFKDRETAIVISKAKEYGFDSVACASTGSSAASLAAYASKAGLKSFVFIPDNAPRGKIVQILMHGAHLIVVNSIYERALKLEIEACEEYGWFNCSHAINPFRMEGDKTTSYEICEELRWKTPDRIIVPTGGGGNLSGLWKEFKEFFVISLIQSLPRMVAVQVEAGPSLAKAFIEEKDEVVPVKVRETVASSILAAYSDYGPIALGALRESKGTAKIVNDKDILEAQALLAQTKGIFAEPSGAAAIAGIVKMIDENEVDKDEIIVCLVTGTGLRDIEVAERLIAEPVKTSPNIEDLRRKLKASGFLN